MRAARLYGKEDIRIDDVEEPALGRGQIKLRNAYAGICGSDLHFYYAPESMTFDINEPHPLTGAKAPLTLGHEFSGTVVAVGEGVTGVKVGDRGAVFPMMASCGECAACRQGLITSCPKMASLGASAESGGLAEFSTFDASLFHPLPESVDLRMGALVEPMAVGWHAVVRSGVEPGGSALIMGAGPIGIGAWFALKAHGIEKVLVSEPSAERRAMIAALGAKVVDPAGDDLAAAVNELTDGDGVDVVIDAAGANAVIAGAIASLRVRGRVVVVALHEHPAEVSLTYLMLHEKEIVGSAGYTPEQFDEVIAAMGRGVYDTTGWVEERPLDDLVESIRDLRNGVGSKVLIDLN